MLSRAQPQQVAGVFEMAGWLGRTLEYYSTDRVLTNLLVARATGTSDTGGNYYLVPDSNYLSTCGAVIRDWSFTGGHSVPPESVKLACLSWLLSQRIPAGVDERSNAVAEATEWRQWAAVGHPEAALGRCMFLLRDQPRSWWALEAQLLLDDLLGDYDAFRALRVDSLAEGDFASDMFYYWARGAATVSDWPRYRSCLKALTGVSGTCGDRAGDIRDLLVQYGYPAPVLVQSVGWWGEIKQLAIWIMKDTPGLDYFLQGRGRVEGGTWEDVTIEPAERDTEWMGLITPEGTNRFFRVGTTIKVVTNSPPFPM
jgi:hypothetical protein